MLVRSLLRLVVILVANLSRAWRKCRQKLAGLVWPLAIAGRTRLLGERITTRVLAQTVQARRRFDGPAGERRLIGGVARCRSRTIGRMRIGHARRVVSFVETRFGLRVVAVLVALIAGGAVTVLRDLVLRGVAIVGRPIGARGRFVIGRSRAASCVAADIVRRIALADQAREFGERIVGLPTRRSIGTRSDAVAAAERAVIVVGHKVRPASGVTRYRLSLVPKLLPRNAYPLAPYAIPVASRMGRTSASRQVLRPQVTRALTPARWQRLLQAQAAPRLVVDHSG